MFHPLRAIPQTARSSDPVWRPYFEAHAQELASLGARPAVLVDVCSQPVRRASELYQLFHQGHHAPRGALPGKALANCLMGSAIAPPHPDHFQDLVSFPAVHEDLAADAATP